jgi:hypothetical protein
VNTNEVIRQRENPMVLSRSADPTKRMAEDTYYRGQPLAHTTVTYKSGTNGNHDPVFQNIGFGLKRRIG